MSYPVLEVWFISPVTFGATRSSIVFQMLLLYCAPPAYHVLFCPFGFPAAVAPGVPPV